MKKVICVGITVLDQIFKVSKIPNQPIKNFATDYYVSGGGNAATAAVAISRAGGDAVFWGRIGDDYNGELILKELGDLGVYIQDVIRIPDARSSVSSILIDKNGERLITNYTDPKLISESGRIPIEKLSDANAVLIDFRWGEGAIKVANQAKKIGIPVVLDADLSPEGISEAIISKSTHVIFSKPALDEFSRGQAIKSALNSVREINNGWVGVTEGSNGTTWLEKDVLKYFPAYKVNVVNTLGAGDVFHGIFALCLSEDKNEEKAIYFASAAAAIHCSRSGGRESIPNLKEIKNFLKKYPL